MGSEADRIEQEIEETRADMTATVGEISRRTDLPRRLTSIVGKGGKPGASGMAAAGAGTGTLVQLGRLREYLDRNPTVKHIVYGFAAGMFSGFYLALKFRRKRRHR